MKNISYPDIRSAFCHSLKLKPDGVVSASNSSVWTCITCSSIRSMKLSSKMAPLLVTWKVFWLKSLHLPDCLGCRSVKAQTFSQIPMAPISPLEDTLWVFCIHWIPSVKAHSSFWWLVRSSEKCVAFWHNFLWNHSRHTQWSYQTKDSRCISLCQSLLHIHKPSHWPSKQSHLLLYWRNNRSPNQENRFLPTGQQPQAGTD